MKKYGQNKYVLGSLVLLVCLLVALVSGKASGSPEGTVKKLESAINSGNAAKILSCYDSDLTMEYKLEKKYDSTVTPMKMLGFEGQKVKLLIESVEKVSEKEADVAVMKILTDKKTKEEYVQMSLLRMNREGGTWAIAY